MNDMSQVIIPKSDQINADDLIAGPMTITINEVQIKGGQEQPVSIYFDGSDKAFRPCKSMSRVLVQAWGADANKYVGRSLTLYRDPTVKWGGMEVGGIRISHMSHLDGEKLMMLTATKGSRKPHKVMPLQAPAKPAASDPAATWANAYIANLASFTDLAALQAFTEVKAAKLAELQTKRPELHQAVADAVEQRTAELSGLGAHPGTAAADKFIAEAEGCIDEAALDALTERSKADLEAMPEDEQMRVEMAFSKVRERISGGTLV